MTDRNELRRLAEACLAHLDSGPLWVEWEENGPGPVEFLGLLDEIERLKAAQGGADRERVKAVRERANLAALVAEAKTFVVSRCGHKGSAPMLRLALKEVWVERDQLRAVAVRMRKALRKVAAGRSGSTTICSGEMSELARNVLADPEVEKL